MLGFTDDRSEKLKALDHIEWRIRTLGNAADAAQRDQDPRYYGFYRAMKDLMSVRTEIYDDRCHPSAAWD